MLKKALAVCFLTVCTMTGLQAQEDKNQNNQKSEENQNEFSSNSLACNCRDRKNDEEKREGETSSLSSIFCHEKQDKETLLACKDCQ